MSLLTKMQESVPFLNRRRPSLPREEMLTLRPVRNPVVTWETPAPDEADERPAGVVLFVPRREDGWGQWLARWLQVPSGKKIELDEFGGEVWEMCDGSHTVDQLVRHTGEKYKLNRRQSEISVVAFMRMLAQRRLIGFATKGKGATHGSPDAGGGAKPKRAKRAGAARRRS